MGTDFQRTILWVFFGMSLFLLWDRWLVYTGKPSMFGTAPAPQVARRFNAADCAPATPASGDARTGSRRNAAIPPAHRRPSTASPRPSRPRPSPTAAKQPPVVIETDVMRATIDPEGAVLIARRTAEAESRARLDREWAAGAGYRQEGRTGTRRSCCSMSARSGSMSRRPALSARTRRCPNHRTPFTVVDGPRTLGARARTPLT